ncbi:B-cell receptor CD22-like [Chaetodon auriga]|uniref:B-cell receptor CD22-like n=1 Tax=Chaetodon auriga TaxID=39042 RepID=UPI004032AC08
MSLVAVLSENMVTANVLLSVFFVSGVLAVCPELSHLFITAPKEMEAPSGSCLLIPCTFRHKPEQQFDSRGETFGVWIKNDVRFKTSPSNVVFNSSGKVNTYPMTITGNLREKNCTTVFSTLTTSHTDKYFFRAENKLFMATAECNPVQITVRDSPARPSIEISGDLKENQSVTISCSAFTPCPHSPPKLTWNLQRDSLNKTEKNTDGTFTTKIQESITLSDHHDGYNITCSAAYPVNDGKGVKTAEEIKTLSVSYAPRNTSVSVSKSGSFVNLTCSSRAKPPVSHVTWFKKSKDGAMNVSEEQFYSLSVTDGGVYYCVATNDVGNQTSSEIDLTAEGKVDIWAVALGGIGAVILICLAVCVWWFKSKHQTPQLTQSQRGDEQALQLPASKTEENIHYGEISFSKQRPQPSTDRGRQQDMLYAQVKVSKPANRSSQTADGDVYAQVKKK